MFSKTAFFVFLSLSLALYANSAPVPAVADGLVARVPIRFKFPGRPAKMPAAKTPPSKQSLTDRIKSKFRGSSRNSTSTENTPISSKSGTFQGVPGGSAGFPSESTDFPTEGGVAPKKSSGMGTAGAGFIGAAAGSAGTTALDRVSEGGFRGEGEGREGLGREGGSSESASSGSFQGDETGAFTEPPTGELSNELPADELPADELPAEDELVPDEGDSSDTDSEPLEPTSEPTKPKSKTKPALSPEDSEEGF